MPHDVKGKLIEEGDFVLAKPYNYAKTAVVGRVVRMREGQTCSGDFSFLTPWDGVKIDAFGSGECELVLKSDGTKPA